MQGTNTKPGQRPSCSTTIVDLKGWHDKNHFARSKVERVLVSSNSGGCNTPRPRVFVHTPAATRHTSARADCCFSNNSNVSPLPCRDGDEDDRRDLLAMDDEDLQL